MPESLGPKSYVCFSSGSDRAVWRPQARVMSLAWLSTQDSWGGWGGGTGQKTRTQGHKCWARGIASCSKEVTRGRLRVSPRLVAPTISSLPNDASYPFLENPLKSIAMHRPLPWAGPGTGDSQRTVPILKELRPTYPEAPHRTSPSPSPELTGV